MKREGFKKVGLSVFAWNERAVSFYKKDDWIQEESGETSLSVRFFRYI
ncbi:Acetyltransferase (fragment) [Candidatus Desulfosporosinus infrequens]|uniref:Acetyltransferase n=1 Tax=Candidatus Desulfosporosinus infrequens TaxID=2043169 RepID=A0A2U3KD19_9FIRM